MTPEEQEEGFQKLAQFLREQIKELEEIKNSFKDQSEMTDEEYNIWINTR